MPTLIEKLEKDISERERVLFEIERVLFTKRYNLSLNHFEIFAVQSISMIYSIWEGFIQTAFNHFIEELNGASVRREDIKNELYIYQIEKRFNQFNEIPQKPNKKLIFYKDLDVFYNNAIISIPKGINTKSNISFEVLNNIMMSFCLQPFDEYWKKYRYPNPSLKDTMKTFLRYRNGVSHGGDISSEEKVNQQVYEKYKFLVLDLMYEIINRMIDCLENENYLMRSNSM